MELLLIEKSAIWSAPNRFDLGEPACAGACSRQEGEDKPLNTGLFKSADCGW